MKYALLLLCLLLCGCDQYAPKTENTGRVTIEDCGVIQSGSVNRRAYILTDTKTGRQFLAVTDCGLLEITEKK